MFSIIKKLFVLLGLFILLSACGPDKISTSTTEQLTTYIVSFDSNGGSELTELTGIVENTRIELPIPEKDGYLFVGWQLNGESFTEEDVVLENMTLKAVWEDLSVLNYEYSDYDDGIRIMGYEGSHEHLTIPNKIEDKFVISIVAHAFENSHIKSLTIPNSVQYIMGEAFFNSHIEKISFYGDMGYKETLISLSWYNDMIEENPEVCVKSPNPEHPDDDTKWILSEGCPISEVIGVTEPIVGPDGNMHYGYEVVMDLDYAIGFTQIPYIADTAFEGTVLKTIEIPKSYQYYENNFNTLSDLFININTLENILVDKDNPYYTSEDGILYNKDKTKLIYYPAGKQESHYKIQSGILIIGKQAFQNAQSLESIEIPNSVLNILDKAFYNASRLESVSFYGDYIGKTEKTFWGAGYENIIEDYRDVCVKSPDPEEPDNDSKWIFSEGCPITKVAKFTPEGHLYRYEVVIDITYYEELKMPYIWEDVFDGTSLKSLELPKRFSSWRILAELELETITLHEDNPHLTIEDGVVYNKDKTELFLYLPTNTETHYEIPASVTKVDIHAFLYTTVLENISVHEDNPSYSSEDGVLFNKDKTELIFYPSGKTDNHYVVPTGITEITNFSFKNPSALVTIELPASVIRIQGFAFSEAESLQNIVLHGTATKLRVAFGTAPFMNSDILIYVPDAAIYDYKRMDGWSEYASRIKSMIIWDYLNQ